MVQRKGMVKALKSKDLKRATVYPLIKQHIQPESTIYTDQFHTYDTLSNHDYKHESVNHGSEQWVNGNAHTNTIESFWSLLKRGHYGIFHSISEKHLHCYLAEYEARWNMSNMKGSERVDALLESTSGLRLNYEGLKA